MFDFLVDPKIGYFEYSPKEDSLLLSDELIKIMGLKKQSSSSRAQSFINCFLEEDRELLQRYLSSQNTLNSKKSLDCHIIKEIGSERTIRICLMPISYQKAEATKVIGILFDMAEYSKFESQLILEKGKCRVYFDMANVLLLSLNVKGKVEAINRKGCEILGLERENIMGKNWISSFVPKGERKKVKEVLSKKNVDNFGEYIQHTNKILSVNGEERIISWHNSFLKDAEGEIVSVLSAGTDITDMQTSEKALAESEEKFKYVFENSCIGNSLTLPTGEVNMNQALCDMLGYSAEEIRGMKWQDLTHAEDIKDSQKQLSKLLKGSQESVSFDKRYIKKDGTILWANVHTSIRKDDKKKPIYYMTSVIDITVQKNAEQELKRSEEKYQLLFSEMKDGFALHEIICDKEGRPVDYRFLDVNPAFEKMTGLKKLEVINKTVLEVLPNTERYWIEQYGQVALTGKPIHEIKGMEDGGDRMIKIQSDASVYDLVTAYPKIQEIMVSLNFKDIVKPGMLQTAGRVMTLKKGATLKKINWETMKDTFKKNGFELE